MWIVSGPVYMERELLVISIQSRNFAAISLLEFVSKWLVSKRLCFKTTGYQRELVSGKRVPSLPGLPWASQLFLNFLTNLCELFTWETVGSDRGVTCLAAVRVTLPPGPTLLHIITSAHLGGSPQLGTDNQSMREQCCQLLACAKKSPFFWYKHLLKLTRLRGWLSFPEQLFFKHSYE